MPSGVRVYVSAFQTPRGTAPADAAVCSVDQLPEAIEVR
jgi:hypothetical protein